MNNRSGSNSTLFLMEQLIVILIFSFCAAVCVKIFVVSFIIASDSNDMTNAMRIAQSGAECYKAADGDAEYAASILGGGTVIDGSILVYYDKDWQICKEDEAVYVLKFTEDKDLYELTSVARPENLFLSNISVEKINGEEITALTVAAIGGNTR